MNERQINDYVCGGNEKAMKETKEWDKKYRFLCCFEVENYVLSWTIM